MRRRKLRLPSVREYVRRVAEFRARYPWVREFSTWNEANLGSTQPTGRHPRRTAVFYRALKRQCRGCTVVAVELLLTSNWRMWRWLRAFRERAGRGRLIFGLHNYPDVTRLRTRATRRFVRRVRNADIWITETGGIVRHRGFSHNERRAARAVRHAFRLTSSLRRIERLYLYNWRDDGNRVWDSGLIARDGAERPAYWELIDGLSLDLFKPPLRVVAPSPEPAPPGETAPPGEPPPPEPAPPLPALPEPPAAAPPPEPSFCEALAAARVFRATVGSGSGFPLSAMSACAVTHTGVWAEPDEYATLPSPRWRRTRYVRARETASPPAPAASRPCTA
jgi:hypothetical protein